MLALTSEAEDDHCPNGGFRDDLLVLSFCRLLFFSLPQFAGSDEEWHLIGVFNQVDLPLGMICDF